MANKRKKEPIHTIFYKCSVYTADKAWSDFLKECSFGKFPRGVRFENNAIKCTRKKNTFAEYVPDDVQLALDVIINVFKNKLGIKTSRENRKENQVFDKAKKTSKITCWKDATTAASKISLIRNFVDRLSSIYYLKDSEKTQLVILLEMAVASKVLNSENIHVQDGKIISIDGLSFDQFTREIYIHTVIPDTPPEINIRPLDFKPVVQKNHIIQYLSLIEYHCKKTCLA
jgi:hypothetical protein